MTRFKKAAGVLLAALLLTQTNGLVVPKVSSEAAEASENIIIDEDFSDYFGGVPDGVSNTGIKALAGKYSEFQKTSLEWKNPYGKNDSGEFENQLVDGLTYSLDTPLENGRYILSFECLFETAPDTDLSVNDRLFMCSVGNNNNSGRSFICKNGNMGFDVNMNTWVPTNQSKFKYDIDRWYHIDMVFTLSEAERSIDYYIDGKWYGSGAKIPDKLYPINKISFRIEDRYSQGSMYLDNIRLTKDTGGRTLGIKNEVLENRDTVDIRLPMSIKADSGKELTKESVSLIDSDGKSIGVSEVKKLTSEIYEIKTVEKLKHGEYEIRIASDAVDYLDGKSLNNVSVGFTIYENVNDIKGKFGLDDTYVILSDEETESKGMTVALKKNTSPELLQKKGIYGWQIITNKENPDLYFDVTDKELSGIADGGDVSVKAVYFDSGYGTLNLYYNSAYLEKEFCGRVELTDIGEWKTHTFDLKLPVFENEIQNNGSGYDFMLSTYSYDRGYSKNSVIVAAVSVKKSKAEIPVKITADSRRIGNIFYTDDELEFDLKLNDLGRTTEVYTREITVTDKSGTVVWKSGPKQANLKKSPVYKEKVVIPKQRYGIYNLTVSVERNGQKIQRSYEFSYVNSGRGEVLNDNLGICMHYSLGDYRNWNSSSETLLDLFSNAGIGWVRDNVNVDDYAVKNSDGTYTRKIPAVLSGYISEITKRKMKFMPILEGGGRWFNNENPLYTEEAQKIFAENAAYYAKDFEAAGVNCFELWNEYNSAAYNIPPKSNLSNDAYYEKTKYYVNFLDYVYTEVKKKSPEFKIIGGGTANVPTTWLNKMFEGIQEKNKGGLMDVLSVHPYIPNPSVSTLVDKIENINKSASSYGLEKYPIWATEFGWPTSGSDGASPERQAQIITSYYILTNAHKKLDKMFIYSYKDNGTDETEKEAQFGLIKANRSDLLDVPCAAKPAYLAVSNMNVQIGDAVSSEVIYDEDSKNLYKYAKKNGDMVYTAWGSGKLSYDFKSPRIIIADIYGNETVSESESGKYEIELSGDVSYIKVPKYNIPTYTVNRESKTARINLGADSGVSEENKPTISTSDGNSVNYELKRDGEAYYAEVSSENNYTVMWTENGYINRFKAAPADKKPQFSDSVSAYCIGINSAEGKVKFSGVSDSKNAELCMAAFFPSQKKSVSPSNGIPAWYDNALTDEYGRYSASFKTEITPGTYALTLSSDSKIETEVMFELKQDIETSLKQGKKLVRDVKDIDAAEPVSVSAYFKNPNEYQNAVLILAVRADNQLKYAEYRTVGRCENDGCGNYRFDVNGSVFRDADGTQVLLWEDLKTLSPLKEIMK